MKKKLSAYQKKQHAIQQKLIDDVGVHQCFDWLLEYSIRLVQSNAKSNINDEPLFDTMPSDAADALTKYLMIVNNNR